MRGRLRAGVLAGVILGSLLTVTAEAQGPFSAQIQRALNAFVGATHTWTANQTFGTVIATGEFQAANGGRFAFTSGGYTSVFEPVASGINRFRDGSGTWGVEWKFDATPTVSACGAGSPAVVAGSTPLSGAVTIGTTSVATCTITFNGTAYPSAPQCTGSVQTTTAANVRAMGYSATTTALTIVPASAWADSSVVNWHCISAK